MFAPATSMSPMELHGPHVTQTESGSISGSRPTASHQPTYVTTERLTVVPTHSAPEEVESIAMLSQMLQNEAQRHQRERAGYAGPAAPAEAAPPAGPSKPPTTAADVITDLMDGRESAAPQAIYLDPAAAAGGAPRISIDHLLGLPGFAGPITPHFLAPRPGGVFVPHPAHRGGAVPTTAPPPPPATSAGAGGAPLKSVEEAEKENGWQRMEIKREPATGPEEAARGLLALHKHHCHRMGADGDTPEGDEFKCDMCDVRLKRKAHMARHRRIHTNERPHVCSVCFKGFIRREHLQRHLKIHEPGYVPPPGPAPSADGRERPHVCQQCGSTFLRRYHLQRHWHTHDPPLDEPAPRHPCDLCGSTFLRREHMRRHRKTHTGKKEHVCYLCGKAFFRREHVRKHVMSHTKSGSVAPRERAAPQQQPPTTITLGGTDLSADDSGSGGVDVQPGPSHHQPRRQSDAPRNHVCGECGRRFSRKEHLQRHESTHSGTRPFACVNCHRTFNRKEHLKKHQQAPNCAGRADEPADGGVKREPEEPSTPLAQPSLLGFQHQLPPHGLLPQHMLATVAGVGAAAHAQLGAATHSQLTTVQLTSGHPLGSPVISSVQLSAHHPLVHAQLGSPHHPLSPPPPLPASHPLDMSTQAQSPAHMATAAECDGRPIQLLLK